MNINIFNNRSPLFEFRWIIIVTLLLLLVTLWYDLTADRLFSQGAQQQWASKGAGYHK